MDKKYGNNEGAVKLLCINAAGTAPVVYLDSNRILRQCCNDGKFHHSGIASDLDLIEITPYDFPMDAKVVCWTDEEGVRYNLHFAGITASGDPLAWANGKTSWSREHTPKIAWEHCELAK